MIDIIRRIGLKAYLGDRDYDILASYITGADKLGMKPPVTRIATELKRERATIYRYIDFYREEQKNAKEES